MNEMMKKEYERWCQFAIGDDDVMQELKEMASDRKALEDAFYRNLAFGTGGLRGVIGAGTNRMNIYMVAKASQGLADYVLKRFSAEKRTIAVSFDSRIKSEIFAKVAAGVFAANGIRVSIYKELMPTPCLSFAVRELNCAAGIMITASHNPSEYNGYKVYGEDGCQITTDAAGDIQKEIDKLDVFADINQMEFQQGIERNLITYIPETTYTAFVEQVKRQSLLTEKDSIDKNVSIVYTPLNGTGLNPVLRALRESGYHNITVVKEQEHPDGNFPTCPFPNPEIQEAMALGLEYAKREHADLLLATDPDCDRVGIAVKNALGKYVLLSGNEIGILLLDYICARRTANGVMPENPVMIKTIVTTDMGERIAEHYGVRTVNVLTGFKFIGEQIGFLEVRAKEAQFIFGFEESYGYLSGSYVRDKDAVGGALLICEMFAWYAARGIRLTEQLQSLYELYGYCLNTVRSYQFEGMEGIEKMEGIMRLFRRGIEKIGGRRVEKMIDYAEGMEGLPKSDVLKFMLEDNCSVVVRPSGTEPKLKVYVSSSAGSRSLAEKVEKAILYDLSKIMHGRA
jgi:Phosphomannomutase